MFKPHGVIRIAVALIVAMAATAAFADTIFMKNGRVIRTGKVRVEGDRVMFRQFGGEVAIPMTLVDRIEADDYGEPEATPAARPTAAPTTGAQPDQADAADADQTPPEFTRDYWQGRIRTIMAEREQLNMRIEELRRQERAFLFSHRSTAGTRVQIEDVETSLAELDQEERDVRAEARRLNIPPGWLRVTETRPGPTGQQG